jgi:2-oxoglutarate dehydrogenase E2 component (dihydrolipoamide succinyltransferase)
MGTAFRAKVVVFGACLAFAAPGCGNSSTPKNPPAQPAVAANAEEQAEAPAEKPPAKVEKKPEAKPAPAPLARHRPQDPTKWELADLQSGLASHDARFLMAVMIFSMQHPNGAKQAEELRGLLERAGQMKDDSSITLPLAPAPVAATATAATPVTPPTAATPPANGAAPPLSGMRRMGRGMGGGLGRPKSAD